jgi:hypothetical protein
MAGFVPSGAPPVSLTTDRGIKGHVLHGGSPVSSEDRIILFARQMPQCLHGGWSRQQRGPLGAGGLQSMTAAGSATSGGIA